MFNPKRESVNTFDIYFALTKIAWAISPAMGGKKNVLAIRITVNFQPNIPTSIGNLETAHRDHPVKKATIVPALAPARRSPATTGKLT
jgi:hypothetical protein